MLINASTVEEPLRDPNCFGSSLDLMAFIIHWKRKDSRTFDKVAVRDIGRRSTRISLTGHVLGTGMTFASFHWYGTHACLMEALKIIDTGSASSNEKVLRNQFGKESGPGDLLDLTALSRGSLLGVLLLCKISRNLVESKPFKTSCEFIFFQIRIYFLKKSSNFN